MGTMDTSISTGICIVGTHEGMGRAPISYLSNRVETSITLSVSMGTIDIPNGDSSTIFVPRL